MSRYNLRCISCDSCCSADAVNADILVMETEFPVDIHPRLCEYLTRLKLSARVLSYEDFDEVLPLFILSLGS